MLKRNKSYSKDAFLEQFDLINSENVFEQLSHIAIVSLKGHLYFSALCLS